MLDVFAYPVSALMALWHDLLGLLVPPDSGTAWVGSILLLVGTVRLLLLGPTWRQLQSARRSAALRPRLLVLKEKHADDQTAYLDAVRRLQREEGVGLAGCLPLLVQLPVFLGLYHLLAGFTAATGAGSNGVFGPAAVQSFAHATLFGVPLAAAVRSPAAVLDALRPGLAVGDVLAVAVPLLVVAAAATLVGALAAARRQAATTTPGDEDVLAQGVRSTTQAMVWLGPLGVLVGGLAFPVPLALVVYWAVNGTWTSVQTVFLNARLDRRPTTGGAAVS